MKKKTKIQFSSMIVILVIVLNVLFTIAVLAVAWHTSTGLDSLVVGWFAFTSTELWSLSKIKREKIGRSIDDDERTDCTETDQ